MILGSLNRKCRSTQNTRGKGDFFRPQLQGLTLYIPKRQRKRPKLQGFKMSGTMAQRAL